MAGTEETIELIHLEIITNHLKSCRANVDIRGLLQMYGGLAGLPQFNPQTTYFEKKIVNEILRGLNLPELASSIIEEKIDKIDP